MNIELGRDEPRGPWHTALEQTPKEAGAAGPTGAPEYVTKLLPQYVWRSPESGGTGVCGE